MKRLAEVLGGDVSVVSAPGEGATFTVRIPVGAVRREPTATPTGGPPA